MFNFTSRFGVVQQVKMLLQWSIWQINKPIHVPLTFPNYAGKHLVAFSFTVFQIAIKAINITWIMPTTRLVDDERCVSECWLKSRRLTSLSSQAHPIGQNREAGIIKETAAAHIHLWGLQSKLLQLLGQQAKLFALAATFLLQISYLWLQRGGITVIPAEFKWK